MAEEIKSNKSMKFDKIQIKLASPENILEWSHGEVTKPETINYRTLKPEKDGLFCERIFGPSKDWECHCGKYKKIKDKGIVCDKCGVEVTKASVRRDRMGHIHLAAPVSHIWYFKGIPSRMDLILDIGPKNLEKVLYFASYIVIDPGETDIPFKKILSETEYRELCEQYGSKAFRVGMGAEAILELLQMVNLEEEEVRLKEELANTTSQKAARLIKRIEVVEAFKNAGTKPEWMILTEIPVIPPDLRPMVQLDGGRFATSDLNDLYRRIINRNNRLARLLELGAPEIIVRNEKRMLQEAVDALIDNGRRNGRPVTGPGNRALKSLSDLLKGKQGRFRQNLLGKRVDYSGRSVIVVGPELKIYQCGLPKEMAIELFKPFVMRELVRRNLADNIKKAKKSVEHLEPEVWDVLEDVIKEHPVMLNRAPTLHRLGIQAFEPILVEGKAIKLHPLVCTAFNADFDGDQMAVHLPLSVEAQAECRFMLLSPNNLLKPSDGGPVAVPSQDMVLGIYYLTQERPGAKGEGKIFKSINEAVLAYENGIITLHAKIMVHVTKNVNGEELSGNIESTLGRLIFNEILPQDLGYVDRSKEENLLLPEVDFHVGKKQLKDILQHVINTHGTTTTAEVLDDIKAMGYKYSTRAAMTVSISEMTVPPVKKQLLAEAEKKVEQITDMEVDFAQWYTDVCKKAELIDYSSIKGMFIYRPYGYALWENIQAELDRRFKATGHENVYLPMLIPESLLQKEKDHVEGFAPECAWVTMGGSEKLEERLAFRPTSETMFCDHWHNVLQSYRELPMLYNQWCSVIRWEKTTRPFLRSREFWWQEGHTIHETAAEAEAETQQQLNCYADTCEQDLAIPVVKGRKTDKEKFAGAEATYTIEAMMKDGKALQSGTSHYFGDKFSKAYDVTFTGRDNQLHHPFQTSWGVSTRLVGAIIMTHGDDDGLILPPAIAPIQVVVVPIAAHKPGVSEKAAELAEKISKYARVKLDDSDNAPGWKFSQWEMKGVPLRLEIGPKDLEKNQCVLVRRDTREKIFVSLDELETAIPAQLEALRKDLYQRALENREKRTWAATTMDEVKELAKANTGYIKTMWCGDLACEMKMKEEAGLSSRCMPFEQEHLSDVCPCCGKPAKAMVYWGVAY